MKIVSSMQMLDKDSITYYMHIRVSPLGATSDHWLNYFLYCICWVRVGLIILKPLSYYFYI